MAIYKKTQFGQKGKESEASHRVSKQTSQMEDHSLPRSRKDVPTVFECQRHHDGIHEHENGVEAQASRKELGDQIKQSRQEIERLQRTILQHEAELQLQLSRSAHRDNQTKLLNDEIAVLQKETKRLRAEIVVREEAFRNEIARREEELRSEVLAREREADLYRSREDTLRQESTLREQAYRAEISMRDAALRNEAVLRECEADLYRRKIEQCNNDMKLIHEENSLLKHRLGMCAKQDEQLCVICMERPSDYAVIPCGHKCVCREDTDLIRQTNECPVCRTTVQGCFLIWHAGV
jgi:hypothetical protein